MYPTPPTVVNHLADANHRGGPWDGAQVIVLHHTGGVNSLDWLSTTSKPPVSVQRLITKTGLIYRIVPDGEQAYHVGRSSIGLHTVAEGDLGSAGEIALGIELENLGTGNDPYPEAQRDACAWQVASWWRAYGVLPIVTHKLIDTKGKIDPAGLDLADIFARAVRWYGVILPPPRPPVGSAYSAESPLIGPPQGTLEAVAANFPIRDDPANADDYTAYDVRSVILPAYWEQATAPGVGLDPVLAIAQMAHETGNLTGFWSWRTQRNPAGIGVTGDWRPADFAQPQPAALWKMNTQRGRWERGNSFADWAKESIPAHIGRLLAYALTDAEATPEQLALIQAALAVRTLPASFRGCAPTLAGLRGTWANPGTVYPESLARRANELTGA